MDTATTYDFLFAKGIEDMGGGSVVLPPRDSNKRVAGGLGQYYHGTRVAITWLTLNTFSRLGLNSGTLLIVSFSGFMPAILNSFHVFMCLHSRDRGQSLLQQSCNP